MGHGDKKRGRRPSRRLPLQVYPPESSEMVATRRSRSSQENISPSVDSKVSGKNNTGGNAAGNNTNRKGIEDPGKEKDINNSRSLASKEKGTVLGTLLSSSDKKKSREGTDATESSATTIATSPSRRSGCSCENCCKEDCGECINCLGKRKFGGNGKIHQRCFSRFCLYSHHSNPSITKRISKHTGAIYFALSTDQNSSQSDKKGSRGVKRAKEHIVGNDSDTEEEDGEGANYSKADERKLSTSSSDDDDIIIANLKKDDENISDDVDTEYPDNQESTVLSQNLKKEDENISDNVDTENPDNQESTVRPQKRKREASIVVTGEGSETNQLPGLRRSRRSNETDEANLDVTADSKNGDGASNNNNADSTSQHRLRIRIPLHDPTIQREMTATGQHVQRAHRVRCKECIACRRPECGKCYSCLARKKFGGDGKSRQSRDPCIYRRCHVIYPPPKGRLDSFDDAHVVRNTKFVLDNFDNIFSTHKLRNNSKEIYNAMEKLVKQSKSGGDSHHETKPTQQGHMVSMKQQNQKPKQQNFTIKLNQRAQNPTSAFMTAVMNAMSKDPRKPSSSVTRKKNVTLEGDEAALASTTAALSGIEPKFKSIYCSILSDLQGAQSEATSSPRSTSTYDTAYTRHSTSSLALSNKSRTEDQPCLYGIPIESDPGATNVCAGCRGAKDPPDSDSETKKKPKRQKNKIKLGSDNDSDDENDDENSDAMLGVEPAEDSSSSSVGMDISNRSGNGNGVHFYHYDNDNSSTVLLCDGYNCGREYHLGCCIPVLTDVPEVERWLCPDCCQDNTTASLLRYLEAFDEAKSSFYFEQNEMMILESKKKQKKQSTGPYRSNASTPTMSFTSHMILKDCVDSDLPPNCDVPVSELERFSRTNYLALLDASEAAQRNGDDNEQEKKSKLKNATPLFYEPVLASLFVGKPIRIYEALSNQYHTGRIVNYRAIKSTVSSDKTGSNGQSEKKRSELDGLYYNEAEFLVRFAAGKDYRKSCYYHWIVLEEHSLAVGMTCVWTKIQQRITTWKPSIVWYRTSRELIPVQHLLDGEKGEIYFQTQRDMFQFYSLQNSFGRSRGAHFTNKVAKKMRRKALALVRTFGAPEEYALIDVRQYAVDLVNEDAVKMHNSKEMVFSYQVALSELKEQDRVRNWWHSMVQGQKLSLDSHAAISSQDYYRLPSLIPRKNYIPDLEDKHRFGELQAKSRHGATVLCPNISLGLDRSLIVQLLRSKQSNCATCQNDLASNIVCDVIPISSDHFNKARLNLL